MAPRKRKKRIIGATGVTRRGDNGVCYWEKGLKWLPEGRGYKSLGTRDEAVALAYAGALQTLIDRGDRGVVLRWLAGEMPIAELARDVREGAWDRLKRLHSDGLRLADEVRDFLAHTEGTKRSRTHRVKESALRLALLHFGEDRRMHTVTKAEAEKYLHAKRGDSPWAPNTQASHKATLSRLWRWSMEREAEAAKLANAAPTLTANPWRSAELPRREKTRFSFFTPEQARRLLAHPSVAGTPRAALFAAAMFAGLRAGELANLRTDVDVDLRGGFLHVQAHAGEYAWKPKTDNSYRKVAIIPALLPYLQRHRELFAGERFFFRAEKWDAPPSISTLGLWTAAAFTAAGFGYGRSGDGLTLHSCRHSFATWMVSASVPVTTVARLMGDTVEVLLATYAHHLPEMETQAYALLDGLAVGSDSRPHTTALPLGTPGVHPVSVHQPEDLDAGTGSDAGAQDAEPSGDGDEPHIARHRSAEVGGAAVSDSGPSVASPTTPGGAR